MKLRSFLVLIFAIASSVAHASARPTSIEFKQGAGCATNSTPCVTRSLPVPASSFSKAQLQYTETLNAGQRKFVLGGQWVQFPESAGPVSSSWIYRITTCPPLPADVSQVVQCSVSNPGTPIGTWMQTHSWTQTAPPGCFVSPTPWQPAAAPPDACHAEQPPPPGGGLNIDFAFVDRSSAEYAAFISFANRTDEADPQTLAYAYKLTGTASYCTRAVTQVAAWMANPSQFAGDSYLQVDQFLAPAMMVREWCPNVTAAQKADWLTKSLATIDALWAQGNAGWGVPDLQNNYHAHFVRATVYAALASRDPARIAFALGKINEQLAALNATQPKGGSLEGTGYQYAWKWLNDAALVLRDSGYGDVFNSNGYLSANTLAWVHSATPDMAHFAPYGSQPRDSSAPFYDYQAGSVKEGCYLTTNAAVKQGAGYFLAHLDLDWYRANSWDNMWRCPMSAVPPALVYNAQHVAIYGRTAWNANAEFDVTVAYDRSQSHAHSEFGEVLYWNRGAWLVTTGQSLSHSGINGEPGGNNGWSTRAKSVVGILSGSTAVTPVEGFPVASNYTENQTTGDHTICLDSAANYPGIVSVLKRCNEVVGGIATVTDYVQLIQNGAAARQQWIVPGAAAPICSGQVCTAGALKLTVVAPNPMRATIVPLSSFDSDFDRGGYRISIDCNGGCQTKLGPAQ